MLLCLRGVVHDGALDFFFLFVLVVNDCFAELFKVCLSLFGNIDELTEFVVFEKVDPADSPVKEILQHSLSFLDY